MTNNNFLTFEIIHHMHLRSKRRRSDVTLKVDMSKAYDKVIWEHLEAVLLKLGFNSRWVQLMMKCVFNVTYRIRVNG